MNNDISDASGDTGNATATLSSPLWEAAHAYAAAVQEIPYVHKVLLEESRNPAYIWTIISTPPFDDTYRTPVYEAEMAILQDAHFPLVGFRLLNVREVDDDLRMHLPASQRVLFERA